MANTNINFSIMKEKKNISDHQASRVELNELFNLYHSKQLIKAKTKGLRLVRQFPKAFILHNMLGLILSDKKEFKKAIDSFKKAIKIKPDFAIAYNNLGNIYKNNGKTNLAIKHYKKAIGINPKSPEPYNNLGNIYKSKNKLLDSINFYKQAININPKLFIVHNNLGIAYKVLGKFNEARQCFIETIKIKPDFYYAHRNLGLINNRKLTSENLEILKNNFINLKKDSDQKRELAFTLGKAHEDIEDYNEAYKYFLQGNAIARKSFNYSIAREKRLFKTIRSSFNRKLYQSIDIKIKKEKITPIFIVGMPRSGTTLVEQILSCHSKIYAAGETEILDRLIVKFINKKLNYTFLNKKNLLNMKFIRRLGNEYILELNKISDGSKFIIDKLPSNFRWIGLIKIILPNAKIIHCNRNARDTCLSIFKNYFPYRAMGYSYSLIETIDYYELYKKLMIYWKSILSDFIYEIKYENLIYSPEIEIKNLLNYLNLKWEKECLNFYNNERPVHTASDAQVRRPIYKNSINYWKKYEKYLPLSFKKLED